ncbi:DUF4136 domain-containing protein [Ramlibacter sp. MMS24-I3-19]|uniref:DUF4136 domain-containing protein n=1 Tax=Ramlibacter sp. MMS24-I3-19 TaxID=3416606 RepID=UPI003CFF8825
MKGALRSIALAGLTALLLAGCASTYRLDNTVQTFSGLPSLPASPTYRFERLPSQLAVPGQETQLEALADPALYKAGLRRDDASPRYSVQLSARITQVLSPWADPWMSPYGLGPGWRHGWGPGWGAPYPPEPPWYVREVGVIVRDVASNKVVYETRAHNDGPWLDHATALAAMFDAALQGFPNPPPGPRRVDIVVGGKQVAVAPAAPAPAAQPTTAAPAAQPAPATR